MATPVPSTVPLPYNFGGHTYWLQPNGSWTNGESSGSSSVGSGTVSQLMQGLGVLDATRVSGGTANIPAGAGGTTTPAAPSNVPLHNNDPNVLGLYNRDPNWLSNFVTPGGALTGTGTGTTTPPATTPPATTPPAGNGGNNGSGSVQPQGNNQSAGNGSGPGGIGNAGGASSGVGGGAAGDNAGHPGNGPNGLTSPNAAGGTTNGLLDGSSLLDIGGVGSGALGAAAMLAPGWAGLGLSLAQMIGRGYNVSQINAIRAQQGLPALDAGQIAGAIGGFNNYGTLNAGNATVANPQQLAQRLQSVPAYQLANSTLGDQPAETVGGGQYTSGPGGVLGAIMGALGLTDTARSLDVGAVNRLTNPNYSDSAWPTAEGDMAAAAPGTPGSVPPAPIQGPAQPIGALLPGVTSAANQSSGGNNLQGTSTAGQVYASPIGPSQVSGSPMPSQTVAEANASNALPKGVVMVNGNPSVYDPKANNGNGAYVKVNITNGVVSTPTKALTQSNGAPANNAPSNLGPGTMSNPGGGTTAPGSAGTGGLNNGFGGGSYARGGFIERPQNALMGGGAKMAEGGPVSVGRMIGRIHGIPVFKTPRGDFVWADGKPVLSQDSPVSAGDGQGRANALGVSSQDMGPPVALSMDADNVASAGKIGPGGTNDRPSSPAAQEDMIREMGEEQPLAQPQAVMPPAPTPTLPQGAPDAPRSEPKLPLWEERQAPVAPGNALAQQPFQQGNALGARASAPVSHGAGAGPAVAVPPELRAIATAAGVHLGPNPTESDLLNLRELLMLRKARGLPLGPPDHMALGGPIQSNGDGRLNPLGVGDTVPISGTPGEFMVNRDSAQALGPPVMHMLNNPQIASWIGKEMKNFGGQGAGATAAARGATAPGPGPMKSQDPHLSDAFLAAITHAQHAPKLAAFLKDGWEKSWA